MKKSKSLGKGLFLSVILLFASFTALFILYQYSRDIAGVYGKHLKSVILYGSYARGDFNDDSDIDIMILLDISDAEIKNYRHELSAITYDYNVEYEIDIKPIAKNEAHFVRWVSAYPFYANVNQEGVKLYGAES